MSETAERVSGENLMDNYVFQRCMFAYHVAKEYLSGAVLEIGTGSGLGVEWMASHCEQLTTIDKFDCGIDFSKYPNVNFKQMTIPPLDAFEDNQFDFVVSFQVIEHIENDGLFLKEIVRVLKPGGKALITTPNISQSLTRNPWHVREYTPEGLYHLMIGQGFCKVETKGTYGSKLVNEYIEENKKQIRKITRFDLFNLQYKLPRFMLKIPYDLLNRMNRKKLAKANSELTKRIGINDFKLLSCDDKCLDLFFIGTK
ncbi:MAG: class I SAM-dependent methyltransferase [Saprospiraceae bacterium]|nr:class I SAM-dependent methyltransferase [Saprospiraceae bacterium]